MLNEEWKKKKPDEGKKGGLFFPFISPLIAA